MRRFTARFLPLAFAMGPFLLLSAQQNPTPEPTAEQAFKNIQVFKGQPASDLIPAMEFMSASLKFECSDCHDSKDYAVETPRKETARKMVLMQRELNAKHFGGKLEVTCNSCHGGKEHPAGTPIPTGVSLRHTRSSNAPKPEELFARHIAQSPEPSQAIVRIGTLTAPNDATHKLETKPVEFIQAPGGRFRIIAGDRKIHSDGKNVWYGGYPLADEPVAIFGRIGRAWWGTAAFAGLDRPTTVGKDDLQKSSFWIVRAQRPATASLEEVAFDSKSGLVSRLVNIRRSSIGAVVSAIDYSNYKVVAGARVPMKVVFTFADDTKWTMDFKTAKAEPALADSAFRPSAP